jgi:hypothetical protein
LDIEVNGQQYQVRTGTEVIRAKTGQEVIVDRTATHRPAVSLYP